MVPDPTDAPDNAAQEAVAYTLTLEVQTLEVEADGLTEVEVIARLDPPLEGRVATFESDLGLWRSSAVEMVGGEARARWIAPTDGELGAAQTAVASLSVSVRVSVLQLEKAEASITVSAPYEGDPVLELTADVTSLVADGLGTVVLTAKGRRMEAGEELTWSTDLGELAAAVSLLDGALESEMELLVPATPGTATITVTGAGGLAQASLTLDFLDEEAPAFDLNGTWAQYGIGRIKLVGGALQPDPQCVLAPSLTLVTVEQDGTDVTLRSVTCALDMPAVSTSGGTTQTTPGPGFLDAIGEVTVAASLDSLELGAVLGGPEEVSVLGADLASPTAPLPTASTDPQVRDPDGDGNPGVTVIVTGTPFGIGDGEQYIINRTRSRMEGVVASSTLIDGSEPGSLVSFSETAVLDSNLANSFSPNGQGLPSVFKAVRVDGQYGAVDLRARDGDATSLSCADVLSAEAELFSDLVAPATPFDCAGL